MSEETDRQDEERANLYQRIGELEGRVAKMERHRTEKGMNAISLTVAQLVEDEFAKHHDFGRAQRLGKMQAIIRAAMHEVLAGERPWDSWRPNSKTFEPKEPTP